MAGGAYALIGSRFRGATSPTLAVEKFLDGIMEENLMSLYGSLLPSDIDGVKRLLDGLTPIRASTTRSGRTTTEDPAERQDASQTLEEVQQAISITGEELEFDEQVIVEDQVSRVTLTKGTISIGIDEQKVADLLLPLTETVIRANLEPSARWYSHNELEIQFQEDLASFRESLTEFAESIRTNSPFDIEREKQRQLDNWGYSQTELTSLDMLDIDFSVVAVKENGNWLISPLETIYFQGNAALNNVIEMGNEAK